MSHFLNVLRASSPEILITAISSILFECSSPSPLLACTTLPLLIGVTDHLSSRTILTRLLPLLTASSSLRSFPATWPLLRSKSQVVVSQIFFSGVEACTTLVPLISQRWYLERVGFQGWEQAWAFGIAWAGTWWSWGQVSPFGRFDVPSPTLASLPSLAWVIRGFGLAGVDLLTGTTAYVIYQFSDLIVPLFGPFLGAEWRDGMMSGTTSFHRLETLAEGQKPDEATSLLPSTNSGSGKKFTLRRRRRSAPTALERTEHPISLAVILVFTWGSIFTLPLPSPVNLSSPLDSFTPLSLGSILPPLHQTRSPLEEYIHQSRILAPQSKLLVWPESAVILYDHGGLTREYAIAQVRQEVSARYGVWVMMGLESDDPLHRGRRRNEVVLVGPRGMIGSYEKQRLVPFTESYPLQMGSAPAPVWDIDLTTPRHVNKTDWTPTLPHIRPIPMTPLICLDMFHPSLLPTASPLPHLLIIPASSPASSMSHQIILQAKALSVAHGISSFVCTSSHAISSATDGSHWSADPGAISALIDPWGRTLVQQSGGESFTVKLVLPYLAGDERALTGFEILGTQGVFGLAVAVLLGGKANRHRNSISDQMARLLPSSRVIRGYIPWISGSEGRDSEDPELDRLVDTDSE